MRVLRGIASAPVRIGFGSSEVVFDMQDSGVKDPFSKVVQEHWSTETRPKPVELSVRGSILGGTFPRPHPWRRCAGPMGAMICYLKQLGFVATSLVQWQRQGRFIPISWGDHASIRLVRQEIDLALQETRWEQIACQAGGGIEATH